MEEVMAIRKGARPRTKFYTSTFEKITEDRRKRILDVAVSEFASNGYNAANINVIAAKAGISIGSMYSYFPSKEALFLTIVDMGFHMLESVLESIDLSYGDIYKVFENLLRASRRYALEYPELNQIYLDLSTQGLSSLSSKLSWQMESITARLYRDVLKKAKLRGIIRQDMDEGLVSFCLDNMIIMFQFSFTSDYYRERMRIFLGDSCTDDEKIISGIMDFVRKALSPQQ